MAEIIVQRALEYWQRACVHSVRVDVCIKELGIDPKVEFDANDGPSTKYILAMDGIHPVATCRLTYLERDGKAKIERVNVQKAYRGMGIGRKLLAEAEAWAKEDGYCTVVITSREEAIPFYKKCGYVAHEDEKYQSAVYVVVPMTKDL